MLVCGLFFPIGGGGFHLFLVAPPAPSPKFHGPPEVTVYNYTSDNVTHPIDVIENCDLDFLLQNANVCFQHKTSTGTHTGL